MIGRLQFAHVNARGRVHRCKRSGFFRVCIAVNEATHKNEKRVAVNGTRR